MSKASASIRILKYWITFWCISVNISCVKSVSFLLFLFTCTTPNSKWLLYNLKPSLFNTDMTEEDGLHFWIQQEKLIQKKTSHVTTHLLMPKLLLTYVGSLMSYPGLDIEYKSTLIPYLTVQFEGLNLYFTSVNNCPCPLVTSYLCCIFQDKAEHLLV